MLTTARLPIIGKSHFVPRDVWIMEDMQLRMFVPDSLTVTMSSERNQGEHNHEDTLYSNVPLYISPHDSVGTEHIRKLQTTPVHCRITLSNSRVCL